MLFSTFLAAYCLFTPPEGWELSDPKTPSRHAICGFIDRSHSGLCPSIHLTREWVTCTQKGYLQQIEQNAKSQKRTWRMIGEVATASGKAHLVHLEVKTPMGEVGLFQAILFHGLEVHVLTAGALKKDFPRLACRFKQAFSTMKIVEDLFEQADDPASLRDAWQKKGEDIDSYLRFVMAQRSLGPVGKLQLMRLP